MHFVEAFMVNKQLSSTVTYKLGWSGSVCLIRNILELRTSLSTGDIESVESVSQPLISYCLSNIFLRPLTFFFSPVIVVLPDISRDHSLTPEF